MEVVTPKILCDLYSMFSQADRDDFLQRIGRISTGREPLVMASALSETQEREFSSRMFGEMVKWLMPLFLTRAIMMVKANPQLDNDEFIRKLDASVTELIEQAAKDSADLTREQIKKARERSSDPDTIRRNVEICDLRKKDKKRWSMNALGKKYDMKRQSIDEILKSEDKWRALFAELPSN